MEEVKYTFDKETRYITRGINSEVPLSLQIILWSMIDNLVEGSIESDYLQVFRFDQKGSVFKVTHSQENPEYKKEYEFDMKASFWPLIGKSIFCIDDIKHSTMLMSNEY